MYILCNKILCDNNVKEFKNGKCLLKALEKLYLVNIYSQSAVWYKYQTQPKGNLCLSVKVSKIVYI